MAASSDNQSLNHVLISGSLDCTVRVWNWDNGCLLWILHHHIAPLKEIILPPPQTARPWNDCFLFVGEDGCVALVSIQTLRVERMFPVHPSCPSMVVWGSRKGYIAYLCRNTSESSDVASILYLWDLKTALEIFSRILCNGISDHSVYCSANDQLILLYLCSKKVPCMAVVENMCYLDGDGKRYYPFVKGSGAQVVKQFGIPNLFDLPIKPILSALGVSEMPEVVADPLNEVAKTFNNLGVCVVQQCAKIGQQVSTAITYDKTIRAIRVKVSDSDEEFLLHPATVRRNDQSAQTVVQIMSKLHKSTSQAWMQEDYQNSLRTVYLNLEVFK
ncbi:uncharacterized protein LOC120249758 isoform X2 [Dioscorea cayenensis subsp. rotundata]|uniref:Uncharacterized protein LOC120249758 isoform X2 n=1 Tax=Dioscorea cayennensis subsp. rotundata TaxID=55577 RepID=A0AB40AHD5_DIOCR|nr:uncharacterized protein LOC120249758 isoform X2 [Dioscorea cayenensis subsp. rotundata]